MKLREIATMIIIGWMLIMGIITNRNLKELCKKEPQVKECKSILQDFNIWNDRSEGWPDGH